MNRLYKMGAITLAMTLALSALAGCSSSVEETTTTETETTTTTTTTTETTQGTTELSADMDVYAITDPFLLTAGIPGDTVIATAGDVEITAEEFLYQVSYLADSYLSSYSYYGITSISWDLDMGDGTTLGDALMVDAIESAVLYSVMDDIAAEQGIYLSTDEQAAVDSLTADLAAAIGSEEAAMLTYIYTPITPEYYEVVYSSGYLGNAMVDSMLADGGELDLSDEELIAYAEEELGIYGAKHILFMTVDYYTGSYLSDEEVAAKLAQAEDVLAQLEVSDDPIALFDELMNEYSDDGRDETTGELYYPDGYNATPGYMVTSFEDTALALEVGEISGIVESEYGYHIILRTDLHVDDSLVSSCESALVSDVEGEWLARYPVTLNEDTFDTLNLETFYNNLTELRAIVGVELEALLGY